MACHEPPLLGEDNGEQTKPKHSEPKSQHQERDIIRHNKSIFSSIYLGREEARPTLGTDRKMSGDLYEDSKL